MSQYEQLGVKWNRLAFSWVLVQPQRDTFNWEVYDRIVESCRQAKINLLATLGGHFDRPPVPEWAGRSLKEVVNEHLEYLEQFVEAWVRRYQQHIQYWEILNEPKVFHKDLTVLEYVEKILKPSYRIIKAVSPDARVLPCAYNNLPVVGNREDFWDAARRHYDIHNYHHYHGWGYFRTQTSAAPDEAELRDFRAQMEQHGEGDKPFWVTETGWWGTASLTGTMYDTYKLFPELWIPTKPAYTGRETLAHPVVLREDALRAVWLKDVFQRLLAIPGCEKVFLWTSLDEFEGGYAPDKLYGVKTTDEPVNQVDLWGIFAGDKSWRRSAFALQEILK